MARTPKARPALPDADPLSASLAPLAIIDPALAARAAAYVADGSDPTVLDNLAAHAEEAALLLGEPGRLYWREGMFRLSHPHQKAIERCLAARHALYTSIGETGADVAMLVRLGQVLAAADGGMTLDGTGSPAPDWLHTLLNDALWATLPKKFDALDHAALAEARPAWDIRLLRALLFEAGLAQELALHIVFERSDAEPSFHDRIYARLLAPGALDDDLSARPDEVRQLAGALSAAGQIMLVKRIAGAEGLRARFADVLVRLAVAGGKAVRTAAERHLGDVAPGVVLELLAAELRGKRAGQRANAALLLATVPHADARSVLEAALSDESAKPVRQAIESALARLDAQGRAADTELPVPPPPPPWRETLLASDALDVLLESRTLLLEDLREAADREAAKKRAGKKADDCQREHHDAIERIGPDQLRAALAALNGEPAEPDAESPLSDYYICELIHLDGALAERDDFGVLQALRLDRRERYYSDEPWFGDAFQHWLARQDPASVDLRQLNEAGARCGFPPDAFAVACVFGSRNLSLLPPAVLPPERVWPCLAEHPHLIDEGLGLTPPTPDGHQDMVATLAALDTFPVVPVRWLPRVLELALGEAATHREQAQDVLDKVPDIGAHAIPALESGKPDVRTAAARWLARLQYRAAVAALYAAFDAETQDAVSAELMAALEALGEDVTPRLTPDRLLAQARKVLKGKLPSGLTWGHLSELPACAWADGSAVEPDIVRWWVVLAAKRKTPALQAMIARHVGLLDAESREELGPHMGL